MVPRFLLSLLVLALSIPAFGSSLALGPEHELAPSTTALRFQGTALAIGAGDDGFLAVWVSPLTTRTYVTRVDRAGQPIDVAGIPLHVYLPEAAVAWNGTEYVVAGMWIAENGGIAIMRVRPDGTVVDVQPRVIVPLYYGSDLEATFNGSELLITWVTQSMLTQTLSGVLLNSDLEVIKQDFVIQTRDLPEILMVPDHDNSHSVATNGEEFLVAWEQLRSPDSFTFAIVDANGEVSQDATFESESPFLQPTVVADRSGFLVLWHDRSAIHARRVANDGTPLSEPVTLAHDERISALRAASSGSELGVAWTAAAAVLRAQRFDSAFQTINEPRTLSDPGQQAHLTTIAATTASIVAAWTSRTSASTPFANAAALGEPSVSTISATILPSSQLSPAAASDGERVLAVWSEQRDQSPASRIFAALLDDDGSVLESPLPISAGDGLTPRIAFGAGRYLVTWNEGAAVVAQFVRRDGSLDGETFIAANTSSSPELVWNGDEFVLIWHDGQTLHSARVSASGAVTEGPSLETDSKVALADLTVGPGGEIAALYRAENAHQMSVRVAVLRLRWLPERTLVSVRRPCFSLSCEDYIPLAIGWSGARYMATWMKTGGPGRPTFLESSTLDGPPRTLAIPGNYPTEVSGEMVWSGTSFLFVYRSHGVSSSWLQTHILRITDDGRSLENPRISTLTSHAGSAPDITLVRPNRAVVVYNRDPAALNTGAPTQRVLARSVTINQRRRAVR